MPVPFKQGDDPLKAGFDVETPPAEKLCKLF